MKIKHLLFFVMMLGMFSFTVAQVQTIIDNTPGTATNDGTINPGEYVDNSVGINGGFGNVIGSNSQLYIDSDLMGNLNFGLVSGGGQFHDNAVIYIDSKPGGFPNTTQFTDNGDPGRAISSGISTQNQNGRADIYFPPGFEADYTVTIEEGDNPGEGFASIFELVAAGSHNYVNSANLNPVGNKVGPWEMNFNLSLIGLAPGQSFKYLVSYGNANDAGGLFRSDEFHGVAQSTVTGGNIGINPITLAAGDYILFYSYAPATSTWTNANFSDDWFDYLNWDNGVPGRFTDVTIPTGVDGYPWLLYDSRIAECDDILIGSDALIVADANLVVNGTTTVQRDYTGGEWHFISSPVEGEDVSIFLTDPPSIYLRSFDNTLVDWIDYGVNGTEPLTPFEGYALWDPNAGTVNFEGDLNYGFFPEVEGTLNLVRTQADNPPNDLYGWNYFGNPYPSTVDWGTDFDLYKDEVEEAIYILNEPGWATYINGVETNGGSRYIAPGQGFFVQKQDNGGPYPEEGSFRMGDQARFNYAAGTFFKTEINNLVRLQVQHGDVVEEAVVYYNDNATLSFNGDYDAHELTNFNPDYPQIYSYTNGRYSIKAIPNSDLITVGVDFATNSGLLTVSATEIVDFEELYLEDVVTGTVTDLTQDSYTFSYDETNKERFILHFKATGVHDHQLPGVNIYSYGHTVYVKTPDNTHGTITVNNLMGQEIAVSAINNNLDKLNIAQPGYYIVTVTTDKGIMSNSILIK